MWNRWLRNRWMRKWWLRHGRMRNGWVSDWGMRATRNVHEPARSLRHTNRRLRPDDGSLSAGGSCPRTAGRLQRSQLPKRTAATDLRTRNIRAGSSSNRPAR